MPEKKKARENISDSLLIVMLLNRIPEDFSKAFSIEITQKSDISKFSEFKIPFVNLCECCKSHELHLPFLHPNPLS